MIENGELILDRDTFFTLSEKMKQLLTIPAHQFKIRIEKDKITIIPHIEPVSIKITK